MRITIRQPFSLFLVLGVFVSFSLGLLSHLQVEAATPRVLYVDRNNSACSESGSGTSVRPYCSISKAAQAATAGTNVAVAGGTYTELVTVPNSGTQEAPIIFHPLNDVPVIIRDKANGFSIYGKKWIFIQDFYITNTTSHGVTIQYSANISLVNNHITKSGQPLSGKTRSGIYLTNTVDSEITGNSVSDNTDSGIFLSTGTSRTTVKGNTTANNARGWQRAAAGIDVRSNGNVITDNISHHNEDSGLQFYQGASDNLITNNIAYLNGDHGIDISSSPRQTVTGNIIYANVTAGLNVEGHFATPSTGTTLRRNIAVDNGINSPRTRGNIRVDDVSTPGTTMDQDVVFLSRPADLLIWGTKAYSSLVTLQKTTHQELLGLQVDPQWVDPAKGNFQLKPTSPLIGW